MSLMSTLFTPPATPVNRSFGLPRSASLTPPAPGIAGPKSTHNYGSLHSLPTPISQGKHNYDKLLNDGGPMTPLKDLIAEHLNREFESQPVRGLHFEFPALPVRSNEAWIIIQEMNKLTGMPLPKVVKNKGKQAILAPVEIWEDERDPDGDHWEMSYGNDGISRRPPLRAMSHREVEERDRILQEQIDANRGRYPGAAADMADAYDGTELIVTGMAALTVDEPANDADSDVTRMAVAALEELAGEASALAALREEEEAMAFGEHKRATALRHAAASRRSARAASRGLRRLGGLASLPVVSGKTPRMKKPSGGKGVYVPGPKTAPSTHASVSGVASARGTRKVATPMPLMRDPIGEPAGAADATTKNRVATVQPAHLDASGNLKPGHPNYMAVPAGRKRKYASYDLPKDWLCPKTSWENFVKIWRDFEWSTKSSPTFSINDSRMLKTLRDYWFVQDEEGIYIRSETHFELPD
ncbi:hypothetical protein DRE_03499 [Drechslerella stenobrocha 248]|uniref:Uncharacterized protein n=1 Tax=Drechslerella stenobrocha 248 TaxID=1043628 RepID=W7IDR3_9PEZI|nr:hypothetical protein DRE_03499 [Drechslerella stenobrocha 248]